jgi:hypothetical protein
MIKGRLSFWLEDAVDREPKSVTVDRDRDRRNLINHNFIHIIDRLGVHLDLRATFRFMPCHYGIKKFFGQMTVDKMRHT